MTEFKLVQNFKLKTKKQNTAILQEAIKAKLQKK